MVKIVSWLSPVDYLCAVNCFDASVGRVLLHPVIPHCPERFGALAAEILRREAYVGVPISCEGHSTGELVFGE